MNDVKIGNAIITYGNINLEYLAVFHDSIGYYIIIKDANGRWINAFWGMNDNDIIPIYEDLNETPFKFRFVLNNPEEADNIDEKDQALINSIVEAIGYNVYTVLRTYDNDLNVSDNFEFELGYLLLNKITGSLETKITFEGLSEPYQNEIADIINRIKNNKLDKIREELSNLLKYGKSPVRAKKLLAQYLEEKHGIILRKDSGDIFKLDATGYTQITTDDIIKLLGDDLGRNIVSDKDINEALGSIYTRLEPQYNIVKFPNCVFDMGKMEIIEPKKPIFTLIESKFNYNPDAKSTLLKEFLYSSLARETAEETENQVKGVLQIIGYLFTSGNKYTFAPIITGVSGSGKSVFSNLIAAIFGSDKIASTSLQEMVKDAHGTSSLINKQLNLIRDSSNIVIEDNGVFKNITGNEDIPVNPKFKKHFVLSKNEVPKTIIVCNNIPKFKVVERPVIERLIIIEFLVKFRDTEKENPNLETDILANSEEMEWLIYQSINEYSKIEDKQDFNLKLDANATLKLMDKHTNPINYLLSLVIEEHNPDKVDEMDNYKPIVASELNQVLVHLSDVHGVEIEVNKKGEIKPNALLYAIKKEFDLYNGESVLTVDGEGNSYHTTRPYTTHSQAVASRQNNKIVEYARCYPNLIANDKYYQILEELFN